jgi:hypothetical protein
MIRTRKILFTGMLLAAAAFALAAQSTISLRVFPKKDETFNYKHTGTLTVMGMDVKATYTQTTKIVEIKEGVMTTESGEVTGTLDVGGQEMPMPETPVTKTQIKIDGTIKEIEGEAASPDTYRTNSVTTIFKPEAAVTVDQEWTWDAAANADLGTRKVQGKYKVIALEEVKGIPTIKISMDVKEVEGDSPASAKGFVWLSVANGMAVKSEMEVKNAPIPGAPEPVSGTLKSELVITP